MIKCWNDKKIKKNPREKPLRRISYLNPDYLLIVIHLVGILSPISRPSTAQGSWYITPVIVSEYKYPGTIPTKNNTINIVFLLNVAPFSSNTAIVTDTIPMAANEIINRKIFIVICFSFLFYLLYLFYLKCQLYLYLRNSTILLCFFSVLLGRYSLIFHVLYFLGLPICLLWSLYREDMDDLDNILFHSHVAVFFLFRLVR